MLTIRWLLVMIVSVLASTVLSRPAFAHAAARCSPGASFFEVGAGARPVGLYVPHERPIESPAPLLILLHGSTGTGEGMLRASGLSAAADRHGFIIAYPDGGIAAKSGFVWNIPGVPTVEGALPGPTDRDDVRYILAIIDNLVRLGCADRTRVYVTGLSGGGRMASWLGCVAPDRFAAIAPVVGLRAGRPLRSDPTTPDPETCDPAKPVAVIAFAGDRDRTNPINGGGAAYWQYTMHAAEQRWAQLNGCTAPPTTRWITASLYEERYGGCLAGTEVVARIAVGGGHEWVVDNDALWALLSRHRRAD